MYLLLMIVIKRLINYFTPIISIAFCFVAICSHYCWADSLNVSAAGEENNETSSWYAINLIDTLRFRTYHLSTEHFKDKYTLFNSDGDVIDEPITTFLEVDGKADIKSRLFFYYKAQLKNSGIFDLKKGYAKYNNGTISLGAGKDTVWMGHGYHGSLLLSNNAEPFPLIKFQTERTLHVPYIGGFDYMIFNGWPEDLKIFGQRLSYKPVEILEFGVNQTVVYKIDYKIWEFLYVISAEEENMPGSMWDNDQRASLDIALYMPFLKKLPFLKNGKLYFEYAGEDLLAWWQKEDKEWFGPLGFELAHQGKIYGLFLTTGPTDFRIEYAQNYINLPLFDDPWGRAGVDRVTSAWYQKYPFVNYGVIMGHHMGSQADDLYFELKHRFNEFHEVKVFYDKERHGLAAFKDNPEEIYQHGFEYSYIYKRFTIEGLFIVNLYKNLDINPDPLTIDIVKGKDAQEMITSIAVTYRFGLK